MDHVIIGSNDLDEGDLYVELTEEEISEVLVDLGANSTRPQGNNVQSDHCFLHGNDDPTLGVSTEAPHKWQCFNPICRRGITIFSLVAVARGITLRQAREWLYQKFPKIRTADRPFKLLEELGDKQEPPRFTLPTSVLAAYSLAANNNLGYRAIDYWGKCSREQADEYKLGYDRKHHRIIVPVFHEDGVLAGLVGRTMIKGVIGNRWYNYDRGQFKTGRVVLGIHRTLTEGPIVVVEGPGDYINLTAMGIPNVHCIFGSEVTSWQVDNLVKWNMPIVPMFDFDKPGLIARRKFIKAVANRVKIWGFEYPAAAFDEKGKADPGAIPHDEAEFLLSTFSEATKIKRLH